MADGSLPTGFEPASEDDFAAVPKKTKSSALPKGFEAASEDQFQDQGALLDLWRDQPISPTVVHAAEDYGLKPGMMAGGAAVGATAGTAAAGPPGGVAGMVAGGGVGSIEGDLLTAKINNYLYGTPIDVNKPGALPGFQHPGGALQESGAIGAASGPVSEYAVEPALGFISGRMGAEGQAMVAAREATETATKKGEAAATGAAEAITAAKEKAGTKLETAATRAEDERAAQKAATQKAMADQEDAIARAKTEQETKNAAAQGDLRAKAQLGLNRFQRNLEETQRDLQQGVDQKPNQLQSQIMSQRKGEAGEGLLKAATGTDPEDVAVRNQHAAGGADVPLSVQAQDAYYNGRDLYHQELNGRYRDVLSPYEKTKVEPTFASAAEDLRNSLTSSGQIKALTPRVNKLLDEANAMGGGAETWNAYYDNLEPDEKAEIDKTVRAGGKAEFNREKGRQISVEKMLNLRNRLTAEAIKPGTNSESASVIRDLTSDLDNTLSESNALPKEARDQLGVLRKQTRQFYDYFPREDATAVGKAQTVADVGKTLFDKDQQGIPLTVVRQLQKEAPEQLEPIRKAYGDYASNFGSDVNRMADFLKRTTGVRKELYAGTRLADAAPWLTMDRKTLGWTDFLKADPAAEKQYTEALQSSIADMTRDRATKVRDSAIGLAKGLGPKGADLAQRLSAIKDPIEAAQMAEQELGKLGPDDFVNALKPTQKSAAAAAAEYRSPADVAKETIERAPKVARKKWIEAQRAASEVENKLVSPEAARAKVISTLPRPHEAALDKLRNLPGGMQGNFMKFRLAYYAFSAFRGLQSGYATMGEFMLPMLGAEAIRAIGRNSLKNPETAEAFLNAIEQKATSSGLQKFGQGMAKVIGAELTNAAKPSNLEGQPQGAPPPTMPAPPPAPPLPPLSKVAMDWKAAPEAARAPLRAEMTRRIKSGDYNRLTEKERKAINPIIADMYRPKPEPALGAGT